MNTDGYSDDEELPPLETDVVFLPPKQTLTKEDTTEDPTVLTLDLYDGEVEITASQRNTLMKHKYFQALLSEQWGNNSQAKVESQLSLTTVQYAMGQINQSEAIGRVFERAYQELKSEFEMVEIPFPGPDFELKSYPWALHPVLRCLDIQKTTEDIPIIHSVEAYEKMFGWGVDVSVEELEQVVDQSNFAAYLELFWRQRTHEFFAFDFSPAATEKIRQHPAIFQTKPDLALKYVKAFPVGLSRDWVNFYLASFPLDAESIIMEKLQTSHRLSDLVLVLKLDPSRLMVCLHRSANSSAAPSDLKELLQTQNYLTEFPLTLAQVSQESPVLQKYLIKWATQQGWTVGEPEEYLAFLSDHPEKWAIKALGVLLNKHPDLPCEIQVTPRNFEAVVPVLDQHAHVEIIMEPAMYMQGMNILQFKTLINRDKRLSFGENRLVVRDDNTIEFLVSRKVYENPDNLFLGSPEIAMRMCREAMAMGLPMHQKYIDYFIQQKCWEMLSSPETMAMLIAQKAYENPDNVFIGSEEMAQTMYRLARDARVRVRDDYLDYFVQQGCWDMLDEMEPLFRQHRNRPVILAKVIDLDIEEITMRFLDWEMTMETAQ